MLASVKRAIGDIIFLRHIRSFYNFTYLTPDEKRGVLASYAADYRVFVETGTYSGLTARQMADVYSDVYTVELDPALFERAAASLSDLANVQCYLGNSAHVLPSILQNITSPAVFWLDAHYSKGMTSRGKSETPILDELSVIFEHTITTHMILIDDARCFIGANGYPTLRHLVSYVHHRSPYGITVRDDIIRIQRNDDWLTQYQQA